jgi:SAM-dependent methyltransferase
MSHQHWDTTLYDNKHAFVANYGDDVLNLLAPQAGETILDVGCGTGQHVAKIHALGAAALGLDNSADMIAKARATHPGLLFTQANIAALDPLLAKQYAGAFDAVFSNATLHWVTDAEAAVRSMSAAIKPGGRFVVEFGGHGNVQGIADAVRTALHDVTGRELRHGWYFPTIGQYAGLLEAHGLAVGAAWLFDRPTRLEGADGMRNWILMFGGGMFGDITDPALKDAVATRAEARLFATHFRDNTWYADYRRIRVSAIKR